MKIRIYRVDEIQKVYRRFAEQASSVVYSEDDGLTWKTPPMDTGKWYITEWGFAFIEMNT